MINRKRMVYHYTSIEALNNILSVYRKSESKENLVFWASEAYAMNDKTEMQYGWDILKNKFRVYEEEKNITEDKRLSVYMDRIANSENAFIFYSHFYREDLTPFFLSFSKNRDELPMWSMYGGAGVGVCLCFDENQLKIDDDSLKVFPMLSALYINHDDNDELSSQILNKLIPETYNDYLKKEYLNDSDKITGIASVLPVISAYVKHCSFDFEKEIRIPMLAKDVCRSVHFRTSSKGNVIPYIEVPIPQISLKEIIVGPCVQFQQIARELKVELSVCGFDITISPSNIPYRIY